MAIQSIRLTKEQERGLWWLMHSGTSAEAAEAKDLLAKSQIAWAIYVGNRVARRLLSRDEIESIALLALALAIQQFNPDRAGLGTIVKIMVRQEINAYRKTMQGIIKIPENHEHTAYAAHAKRFRKRTPSLDVEVDDKGNTRLDLLQYKEPSPAALAEAKDAQLRLFDLYTASMAMVRRARDRQILSRRHRGQTLDQIGKALGITRERVRQLENRARREFESAMQTIDVDLIRELMASMEVGQ